MSNEVPVEQALSLLVSEKNLSLSTLSVLHFLKPIHFLQTKLSPIIYSENPICKGNKNYIEKSITSRNRG